MNYLIQRGKVRGQVINVPEGLPEILADITREVLRCQPTTECLCQFIIDYLHSVIVTREKARVAQAIIERALRTVDEIIANLCICHVTKEKAEIMASTMEECFRRFLEKRRCELRREQEVISFEEEDMLDELMRRCKFSDDELKIARPAIEEAYNRFVQAYMSATDDADGTETLYQYLKMREEKRMEEFRRHSAAVRIQSNFRGWNARKHLYFEIQLRMSQMEGEQREKAAERIQRFYRMHSLTGQEEQPDQKPPALGMHICTPVSVLSLELDHGGIDGQPPSEDDDNIDVDQKSAASHAGQVDHVTDAVSEGKASEAHSEVKSELHEAKEEEHAAPAPPPPPEAPEPEPAPALEPEPKADAPEAPAEEPQPEAAPAAEPPPEA